MKKETIDENRCCRKCGRVENQVNAGYNRSGTQRCVCKNCKHKYTLHGKTREYPEEIKQQAIRIYYSGVSGRGVGKILRMSKANVLNWIKKPDAVWISGKLDGVFELDELYWFLERKSLTETRENVYLMTMVSREPRQIVGCDVARDISPKRIQTMVDSAPEAQKYCTDGYLGYVDVVYPGKHIRNVRNENDTFTVEGVNADLRHYIPGLDPRSRCFYRKIETLDAVISVFVDAYNKFGEAKLKYRVPVNHKSSIHAKHLHKFRDFPFSIFDYL